MFAPSLALLCLASPAIQRVTLVTGPASVWGRSEYAVDLTADYRNPFDPAEVVLDLEVVQPSGRKLSVPGFLYRPYRRGVGKMTMPVAYHSTEALKTGAAKERTYDKGEILIPQSKESWRVRFTPVETGRHRLTFVVRDRHGIARRTAELSVSSAKKQAGFARIDPKNPRGFRLSSGQSFFPIGANLGWAGERGTRDYDDWMKEYGKVGANWGRVWLSPSWTTFALEHPGKSGQIDLANAWRLDYVLGLADKNGMRLALCIDSYNVLRDRINWPEWERSPFNKANGGPATAPSEFWTNPEAARLYKNKLRYIVARWGADPSVFAWEFWNEVDGITDYKVDPVRAWHQQMGRYLRSIDPYRHLISTSFGGNGSGAGDASVFELPEMDYAVSHLYDAPDGPAAVVTAQRRLGKLPKPHFVAEFGADASGSRGDEDKEGIQLHDPLWASIAAGASGGSMLWWWDSFIHPRRLYPQLQSASAFMKGIDWGQARLVEREARIEYQVKPKKLPRRDLRLEGGIANWSPSEVNRPKTIKIDRSGVHGGAVAGFQHGIRNHLDLHNPLTFQTDLPWPTRFVIEVGEASGYGGAALRVTIDGKQALDETYPDPDEDRVTTSLRQFVGPRTFDLPAGRHTILIENNGADWVKVDYRFEGALERTTPALVAWASAGPNLALAWVRHEDRTWRNVVERKLPIAPAPPSVLVLDRLQSGRWEATLWNTWTGKPAGRETIKVTKDGKARVRLPAIGKDLAVKLTRTGAN